MFFGFKVKDFFRGGLAKSKTDGLAKCMASGL